MSVSLYQRVVDFTDEFESNEVAERMYDNAFTLYYPLLSALEDAQVSIREGDYHNAYDSLYEFVTLIDSLPSEWEDVAEVETYEFDEIVREVKRLTEE